MTTTAQNIARTPRPSPALPLYFIALEASFAVFLLCWYKKSSAALTAFLQRPAGWIFVGTLVVAVTAGVAIVREHRRCRQPQDRKIFRFTVLMNVLMLILVFGAGESAIRLLARTSPEGVAVGSQPLPPQHDWQRQVASNRQAIERGGFKGGSEGGSNGDWSQTYFVPDSLLGWTVGPSRRSEDHLYASSPDGIRSATPGFPFDSVTPLRRIALLGDSYTFGLEVSYPDSWGWQLQRQLGTGFQVLNFGVDGFGVDQAFLRYGRDVPRWKPQLTIFSVSAHDVFRTASVYPFVTFGWDMPFAKPRFVLRDGNLTLVNMPLPTSERIVRYGAIGELPFLDYEPGYKPEEWHSYPLDASYFIRFLRGRFPPWTPPTLETSDEQLKAVNIALLRELKKRAAADGTQLIIAYLPSKGDFSGGTGSTYTREARAILDASGIAYEDFTPCIAAVSPEQRFLKFHYSPISNRALADCMGKNIRERLDGPHP